MLSVHAAGHLRDPEGPRQRSYAHLAKSRSTLATISQIQPPKCLKIALTLQSVAATRNILNAFEQADCCGLFDIGITIHVKRFDRAENVGKPEVLVTFKEIAKVVSEIAKLAVNEALVTVIVIVGHEPLETIRV